MADLNTNVEPMAKLPRILLVGHTEDDVALVRDTLVHIDCRIETVTTGANAFNRIQSFQPQLVVLDTTIVNPDAYELCARIKSDHTAIVLIMTALNEPNDINCAVDAGTDDFLSKPIKKHELRKRVENLLKLHEQLH